LLKAVRYASRDAQLSFYRLRSMQSQIRADKLLAENIRALLCHRGVEAQALAIWCGHRKAWISKVLSGDRGLPVRELNKVADFFGLTVAELFSPGISPLYERRHAERRANDRRSEGDRRGATREDAIHAATRARFSPKRAG